MIKNNDINIKITHLLFFIYLAYFLSGQISIGYINQPILKWTWCRLLGRYFMTQIHPKSREEFLMKDFVITKALRLGQELILVSFGMSLFCSVSLQAMASSIYFIWCRYFSHCICPAPPALKPQMLKILSLIYWHLFFAFTLSYIILIMTTSCSFSRRFSWTNISAFHSSVCTCMFDI